MRCLVSVALLAGACAVSLVAQQGIPPVNHAKLEKLAEPWPEPEVVHARRIEAEQRRLFADTDPFPFTLQAEPGRVRVGMPIMSKRAALSSWLALLAQRFGAAKPTTPRHWTYDKAPVKIDATLDDLGDLEVVLTPP